MILGRQGVKVRLESGVKQVCLGLQEQSVLQGQLDQMVFRDLQVPKVILGMLGVRELLEYKVYQDQMEHKVLKVEQVFQDQQEVRDQRDQLDQQDHQDQ